jgi:hypothetical protein
VLLDHVKNAEQLEIGWEVVEFVMRVTAGVHTVGGNSCLLQASEQL